MLFDRVSDRDLEVRLPGQDLGRRSAMEQLHQGALHRGLLESYGPFLRHPKPYLR